jgi:hypothetical protein
MKKDGRRALFALMQTYSPVSTNAGNNAEAKLESTRFQQDKNTIDQQITDFYINVAAFEAARDKKLETLELWAFITSAIKERNWKSFRLTMSMQKEYKDHKSFWFVDEVREYVLALEEDRDTSPPPENDLRDVISKLAASVEAIQARSKRQASVEASSHQASKRVKSSQPYDVKMGPCRFCGGGHKHRDCHTLRTTSPMPPIPSRAGAAKGVPDNNLSGCLMGAVAADQPECSSRFPFFALFTASLAVVFWLVIAYTSYATRDNISFQQNLRCKAVACCALTPSFDTGFGVDSCTSDHICHDEICHDHICMFTTLDFSKYKTFEVVHGKTITSSSMGDVDHLVATTWGKPRVTTLRNVHCIPQQNMSLISVDKETCDQGFDSPDFKNLTWRADDTCTLKILKTNGMLDAAVKYGSKKNGVRGQHRQSKTASGSSTTSAVTALGRNSWDWMFHKEEYMKLVSAGYMTADPKNRREVFSDGDHISGNSLEPGGWSLENDNGAYKPGQDWTHTFDSGYLQPARTAGGPHREL